jgi:ABC-type Mn2+/Zn2+ transport system permease subunit
MLAYEFMRTAFMAAFLVSLVCGPVGWFLVLRGQSFASHALAHVGFAGAAAALLAGLPALADLGAVLCWAAWPWALPDNAHWGAMSSSGLCCLWHWASGLCACIS